MKIYKLIALFIIFIISIFLSYKLQVVNIIEAIVCGSCLSLAGMILQSISRNPLADPYLIGLSSGAGLGITLTVIISTTLLSSATLGFLGALIVAVIVVGITCLSGFKIEKLLLVGLSINVLSSSIIGFLTILNPDKTYELTLLLIGSFNHKTPSWIELLLLIFGISLVILLIPKLEKLRIDNRLSFPNEKKYNLAIIQSVIISAFLTSISVLVAGVVGFIGIVCPNLSKLIIGGNPKNLLVANIFVGSSIMLLANIMTTNLINKTLPLGITVAFVGAPLFVIFLLKGNKNA